VDSLDEVVGDVNGDGLVNSGDTGDHPLRRKERHAHDGLAGQFHVLFRLSRRGGRGGSPTRAQHSEYALLFLPPSAQSVSNPLNMTTLFFWVSYAMFNTDRNERARLQTSRFSVCSP